MFCLSLDHHKFKKCLRKRFPNFILNWYTQIPDIMKPATPDDCVTFADLILHAMFFLSLNDEELQKAITDLKVAQPTLTPYG